MASRGNFVSRHVRLIAHCCAALALVLPGAAQAQAAAAAATGYRLGIFPYLSPRQTVDLYGPASISMGRALGLPVKLESAGSFTDFLKGIADHNYDIALIQPFDYVEAVEKQGYIPLARLAAPLVTQFFVRADSAYRKLEDLRGTTIAMPPAVSANARMALRALHDNKLLPGRDVEVHYFNAHDSCIHQVWVGSAGACATAQPPVTVFEQRMQASLRPIHSTPAIPHIVFVAHPRLPAADRAKLQETIIGWQQTDEGRALLKALGFPGFGPIQPGEYAVMRGYDPVAPVAPAAPKAARELVLGVFPYMTQRQLTEILAPVMPALGKAAAVPVHLGTAVNFGSFSDALAGGGYDIVLVQPFDYARAISAGYLPLAGMRNRLQGAFFALDQSPYRQIADFKGKVVAMPPTDSALARLGRHALEQSGLVPGRDVAIDYRQTHDSCLQQVQRGAAAACVTVESHLKLLPAEFTQGLRGVGRTETVPGVLFMAHKRLDAQLRARLQAEILSWKDGDEGRKILQAMQTGEFVPVNADDYRRMPAFR